MPTNLSNPQQLKEQAGQMLPSTLPQQAHDQASIAMLSGGVMIGLALTRGRLLGTLLAAVGGGLVCHALMHRDLGRSQSAASGRGRQQPSRMPQEPHAEPDMVDEASWESFPASDPPAWY